MNKSTTRSDGFSIRGVIIVETRDAVTGELIPQESSINENIVTNVGLPELLRLINLGASVTGYEIGVGTSTTTPAATDTALGASVLQSAITTRSLSGTTLTFKLFIDNGEANGNTLTEAGLFHDSVLIDHALFAASIVKTSAKNVTVTIQLTLSR